MRNGLLTLPGEPELCVVTIGYSSERVRKLVEKVSYLIVFGDPEFEQKLQTMLTDLLLARQKVRSSATPPPTPMFEQVLRQIGELRRDLGDIKDRREEQAQATAKNLEEGVAAAAEEMRAKSDARTRWELIETLDSLRHALEMQDLRAEAGLLRSVPDRQ